MSLKFFYKLDGSGNPIPGSNVVGMRKPKMGRYVEFTYDPTCCNPSMDINLVNNAHEFKYYVRLDGNGRPVNFTLRKAHNMPKEGHWQQVLPACCNGTLAAPGSFAATADSSPSVAIDLSWTAVSGATTYTVQKSTSSTFSSGVTTIYTGSGTNTVATGLTTGTHYYFRIKASGPGWTSSTYSLANRSTT